MSNYAHDTAARSSMKYARRPKRRVRLTDHVVLMLALLVGMTLLGMGLIFLRGK